MEWTWGWTQGREYLIKKSEEGLMDRSGPVPPLWGVTMAEKGPPRGQPEGLVLGDLAQTVGTARRKPLVLLGPNSLAWTNGPRD